MLLQAKTDVFLEAGALHSMIDMMDGRFEAAIALLKSATGRVVVTGMGKNGHVGGKIAATMASTGTPAMFLHPGEALHGDLGMITPQDALLALSNSGENYEVLRVIDHARECGNPVVAMTAKPTSALARISDVTLLIPDVPEACPLGKAPTVSTTCMMALGDALALALMRSRDFTADDFRRLHPAGALGRVTDGDHRSGSRRRG